MPPPESDVAYAVTGATLEEALARATRTYGDGVRVIAAQRVRVGLFGRFEVRLVLDPFAEDGAADGVDAVGDPAAADGVDAVGDRAAADGGAADGGAADGGAGVAGAAASSRAGTDAGESVDVALSDLLARARPGTDAADGVDVALADLLARADRDEATVVTPVRPTGPVTAPAVAPVLARLPALPAARSLRVALADLGVPVAVLGRMPVEEPDDPAPALERAIAAVLPQATRPGPDVPVTVDGYGPAGAVAILQAALRGLPPGRLTAPGADPAPVTPRLLAEVLLACVS